MLFWLQIIPSHPIKPKLGTGARIGAILGTNVVMIFLAMALSIFTNHSLYPVYDHLPGITLSPFASQQIGAAILWVCGSVSALPTLSVLFRRAMAEEGRRQCPGGQDASRFRAGGPADAWLRGGQQVAGQVTGR